MKPGLILGLIVVLVPRLVAAQTPPTLASFSGPATVQGASVVSVSLPTQFTHIYVFSPPVVSSTNNTKFLANVMPQAAIDGVSVLVHWGKVETSAPASGACGGANSDIMQTDSVGYCHTYSWTALDGTACSLPGSAGTGFAQFFCTANTWGTKSVNPLISGISNTPNTDTPDYVFSASWASATSATQHVINNLKDACGLYKGYSTVTSASMNATGTVTLTFSGAVPFSDGDTIWVANFLPASFNVTSQAGATFQISGSTYTYKSGCSSGCTAVSTTQGQVVSAQSSWPIPSDKPYMVAYRAFVAAAAYHYGHDRTDGKVNPSQVAYFRAGYARGAEGNVECWRQWPGYVSDAQSKQDWLNFYADTSSYVMGLQAPFHIQTSINEAILPSGTIDTTWASAEAGISVQYSGGNDGKVFGFGAQGLQQSDITNYSMMLPCTSDWCAQFDQYWPGGPSYQYTDFELQQIDCSNPDNGGSGSDTCFQGGHPGKTGDLRTLLPFVTARHATILELYYQDAALAYDPSFCTVSGSTCSASGEVFSGLSAATQYDFFNAVGQGTNCPAHVSGGTGDCSYANALNAAHGNH
jgi:hypothetical protein